MRGVVSYGWCNYVGSSLIKSGVVCRCVCLVCVGCSLSRLIDCKLLEYTHIRKLLEQLTFLNYWNSHTKLMETHSHSSRHYVFRNHHHLSRRRCSSEDVKTCADK